MLKIKLVFCVLLVVDVVMEIGLLYYVEIGIINGFVIVDLFKRIYGF